MSQYARTGPMLDSALIAAFSLAIPVLAMTSLVHGQLPGTHDAYLHLVRLINATLNIEAGSLIPRWGPQLHFGFGYPLGDFYAPGWHILGGLLVAAGAPAVGVWLLAQSIGVILYPVGGYLFARQFTDRAGALLGAAVCLFAPFRYYELFAQGNLSQFIAMGLIAWVLWAFARCARTPSPARVALAGLILAALIIMHHPTAAFMIPFAGVYAAFAAIVAPHNQHREGGWAARFHPLIANLCAYGLALLLAATYWLPALAEVPYVSVQSAADQFQLEQNFLPLTDLLGPVQPPDRGSLNVPFALSIGQVGLALAVIGVLLVLSRRVRASWWQRAHIIGGAVVAAFGIYAMTPASMWLWMAIPKAALILFPWRLIGLVVAALIPASTFALRALPQRWQAGAAGALIGGLFFIVMPLLFPIYADVTVAAPVTPATSVQFEIDSGNLGGVSNNEYLPYWATQRPDFSPCAACYSSWVWQIFVNTAALPAGVSVTPAAGAHRLSSAFSVDASAAAPIELRQMYFPGWEAAIDGQPTTIAINAPYGLMHVDMPAGRHQLEVWYAGTSAQHMGDLLSLIGLIACLGLVGIPRMRRSRSRVVAAALATEPAPLLSFPRLERGIVVLMISAALILAGFIAPSTCWFRAAGTMAAPLGAEHLTNAVFANKVSAPLIKLIGYTLAQDSAHYGEQVRIRLFWQVLAPTETRWTIKIALADPATQAEWAASESGTPGGFSVPAWFTDKDKYVIDDRILTIPAGTPPYIGDLAIQIYSGSERLLVGGADRLILDHLRIAEQGSAVLPQGTRPIDVTFSDWLRLRAAQITPTDRGPRLMLYWEVLRAPATDMVLMLHLISGGTEIGTADQPPIPAYPTVSWQAGQYLVSSIDLTLPVSADAIFIGIYDRATVQRAPVVAPAGAFTIVDNGLLLPISQIGRGTPP